MRAFVWCAGFLAVVSTALVGDVQAEETAVPLNKLPQAVTQAVKKMFPKAEMVKASQEEEDGHIDYEVSLKLDGKKIEVTVDGDGSFDEIEKEIAVKELPKAVKAMLTKMHPDAKRKSAEAVYEVEDGEQELEYYEVQLKMADGSAKEVKIKADGTVVKDDDDEEHEKDDDDKEEKGDKD